MAFPMFYKAMNYPVPEEHWYYRYINEDYQWHYPIKNHQNKTFSWKDQNNLMKSYKQFLCEHMGFLSYIPFIEQIYLCNSITFNALHPWSDIDLCIISKPWYLWYARAWSWLFFSLLKLKRSAQIWDHSFKFCLSFYIDGDHTNLINLRNPQGDVYLSYWLAHTVLLYTTHHYPDNHLHKTNKQLLSYLPNHPDKQTIFLDIPVYSQKSNITNMIEKVFSTLPGKWIQHIIERLRWWIINTYKTSKLPPHTKEYIITSSTMLKFYTDKRVLYQHKRKTASRKK